MDLTNAKWRKSSYTGSNGGNCVEVAGLVWRKSARSGENGGDCVELADAAGAVAEAVAVRDSKDPGGPVLLVTRMALRSAVNSARATR
ncbi:DUF397 domain-containing protein [Actinomadura nitritigenes]|uniref:DUF397 domain-containing protein n=1 Tax=Actinomadura nitritigenes TaxID=134602 RepID=UPI003D947503